MARTTAGKSIVDSTNYIELHINSLKEFNTTSPILTQKLISVYCP